MFIDITRNQDALTKITNRNIQAQKDELLLQKLHNQQFSN